MKEFVVKSPIYGYNGQGFENQKHILTYFDAKDDAIMYKNRCNKAFEIGEKYENTDNECIFYDRITNINSYKFVGLSVAYKITLEEI